MNHLEQNFKEHGMELLMFSRMNHIEKALGLDKLETVHPEVFQRMLELHQLPFTQKERKMHLLGTAEYILENCCTEEQVSAIEQEIRNEWPGIAANTVMQETIIFWLLWNDFPKPGNPGTAGGAVHA